MEFERVRFLIEIKHRFKLVHYKCNGRYFYKISDEYKINLCDNRKGTNIKYLTINDLVCT